MKITIKHLNLRSAHGVDAQLENEILALQAVVDIEEARVVLERCSEGGWAFQVLIHLVVPGPDIQVAGADHTLEAAIRKAVLQLREEIRRREANRLTRVRSNLQSPSHHRMAARNARKS